MALRYRTADGTDGRRDASLALMLRVRCLLDVDADTVVSVAGHHCGDPGCDEAGTTILLMRSGQPTAAIRIAKPLEAVTDDDLRAALQPITQQRHAP